MGKPGVRLVGLDPPERIDFLRLEASPARNSPS
jgi:hypothetical protein